MPRSVDLSLKNPNRIVMFPNRIWAKSGKSHRRHLKAAPTVTAALHPSMPQPASAFRPAGHGQPPEGSFKSESAGQFFQMLICRMVHVSEAHFLRFKHKLVTYTQFTPNIVLLTTNRPHVLCQ